MGGFKRKGWSVESLVGRNGGKDREPTPSFGEGALEAQKELFPEGVCVCVYLCMCSQQFSKSRTRIRTQPSLTLILYSVTMVLVLGFIHLQWNLSGII